MRNITKAIILSCSVLLATACNESRSVTINERYPMPWREPNGKELSALGQVIKKKGIGACSKYQVRAADGAPGEYLVACTADGQTWNYYIINAVVGETVGPITDSTLAIPK